MRIMAKFYQVFKKKKGTRLYQVKETLQVINLIKMRIKKIKLLI